MISMPENSEKFQFSLRIKPIKKPCNVKKKPLKNSGGFLLLRCCCYCFAAITFKPMIFIVMQLSFFIISILALIFLKVKPSLKKWLIYLYNLLDYLYLLLINFLIYLEFIAQIKMC